MRLVDVDNIRDILTQDWFLDVLLTKTKKKELATELSNMVYSVPVAYDVDKVVEEVKKLDLDGVSMVEDGRYKLIRKNEVIELIQTNGICNGRLGTCAKCFKLNCPLSTEATISDKWSKEVLAGGKE